MEQILAQVWLEVLGVEHIGVTDNFFELGGHSLLGMKLVARISDRLSMPLSIVALFQHPTVRSLAEFFEESKRSQGTATKVAVPFDEGVI
jgi:acyl carrier protein